MSPLDPVNVLDYERLAREQTDQAVWDYVAGGANDEITLRENRAAFDRIRLRPRVLIDVSTVSTTTDVLGTPIAFPAIVAPTAFQTLVHPGGESATARGTAAADTIMAVSTLASQTLEQVAAAAPGPKWFQLYCYRERHVTQRLIERAERAGYRAICMTVDVPRLGRRERDLRNRFAFPPDVIPRNFEDVADLGAVADEDVSSQLASYVAGLLDSALTWKDVTWLKSLTTLPIIVKGILTADDAALALDCGVDGIVVSNHGGRQLDGVPATIEVLAEIVGTVNGRVPVLVDGGVRRGTDIVKAIALGARAVLVGRPILWGLALTGERGVRRVLELLRAEFELALALCGAPSPAAVGPKHIQRHT